MDQTTNLGLPYIAAAQAQKHITHNEAIRMLDIVVQLHILNRNLSAPPASLNNGDSYIIADAATAAWSGKVGQIASYQDDSWFFYTPLEGWLAWISDESKFFVFNGTTWIEMSGSGGGSASVNPVSLVGVNATADATNRLAVKSDAVLFSHDDVTPGSGSIQTKLNKKVSSDTASFLFQTDWSGRAEIGLTGDDDFHFKVSNDGSSWKQAILIDRSSGIVNFPSGISGVLPTEFGGGSLVNTDYITSKGADLVTNGTGLLGNNYNMPADYAWDAIVSPSLAASFRYDGYYPGSRYTTEFMAVNPNLAYRLGCFIREDGYDHLQYMGIVEYDFDKNQISSHHHRRWRHGGVDSYTTLTAPLTPGDTTISVVNAAGWNETSTGYSPRGYIIFEYKNSAGFKYDYYSRIVGFGMFDLGGVNKTTNVITLNKPFPANNGNPDDPNGTWPIGTKIANSVSSGAYKYSFLAGFRVPQVGKWYQTETIMGGIDKSGNNVSYNFSPGSAYAKIGWLPNFSNVAGGNGTHPDSGAAHSVWFAGISVVPEPMTKFSNNSNGSIDIALPQINAAGTAMEITNAAIKIREV